MKKDFIRDYTTEMFRQYAACGKITAEVYKLLKVDASIISRSYETNAFRALLDGYESAERAAAVIDDLKAVEKTIMQFKQANKEYIISALDAVYFAAPTTPLRRGDISARVRRFALTLPASEKQVYQWLREARLLCAVNRGLRIPSTKR